MKYNGIIARKIRVMRDELSMLRNLESVTIKKLDSDLFFKHGIERSLQILVECMIDIANRILALENDSPATTSAESMELLDKKGIIKDYNIYSQMVQFRNFVVHRYEIVDSDILAEICSKRLSDFESFIEEIESY